MRSKIIRGAGGDAARVVSFGRDAMEEFPEAPVEALPEFAPEVEETEEAPPDPEAIRAAVLAEAKAEAEVKLQEAYQEGLRRGEEAGRAAFDESLAHSAAALNEAAAAIQSARQEFLDGLEPQLVDLAVAIAERVLQRECRQDSELIHATVKRALAKLADRQHLQLYLHPDDFAALNEHKISLIDEFPGVEGIEIHADETVTPGGCVIASETMQVDARIETLLADVIDVLLDRQDEPR